MRQWYAGLELNVNVTITAHFYGPWNIHRGIFIGPQGRNETASSDCTMGFHTGLSTPHLHIHIQIYLHHYLFLAEYSS